MWYLLPASIALVGQLLLTGKRVVSGGDTHG